jgi:hypothetical protein
MDWPPQASMERTDRMLVFMGPVSLVVYRQQRVPLPLTASMAGSGEKLGTNPQIDQPSCYGLCREPFFSGAVALFIYVDDGAKSCYMWTT